MWKEPCHPNGVITRYRLVYSETSSAEKRTLYLSKHERFYSIGGLKLDTQYEVQLSSSTSKGFGSPAKVVVRTKITASKWTDYVMDSSFSFLHHSNS